jgi:hypothetical protein
MFLYVFHFVDVLQISPGIMQHLAEMIHTYISIREEAGLGVP